MPALCLTREQTEEGLSRGVVGGMVLQWSCFGPPPTGCYSLTTNSGEELRLSQAEAAAFALAVFAAEKVWDRRGAQAD